MIVALLLAAQITNVADAADEKHPLEVDLEAEYTHLRTQTTISRENAGDVLMHVRTLDAINFRLAIGIWHDLELHAMVPLALQDVQTWHPLSGAGSLTTNVSVSGCGGTLCGGPPQPILPVDGQSKRAGLFEPTFGIAWAPINEERQERLRPELFPEGHAYSTWALGVDYTAPIGNRLDDPSRWGFNAASSNPTPPNAGSEIRKVHVVTLWTAFSKRFRVLEPYFRLSGSLPFAANGAYDNCSHPQFLSDVAAANCAPGLWAGQTGYKPPFEGSATLGAELVAAEGNDQRLSFDVRGDVTWHGPQRGYTQVADALGKLTYADEYVTTAGTIGIYGRVARWFHMRVYGVLGVDSAHFLTHEDIGDDKDKDGKITVSEGTGAAAPDQNPNYDFRIDQVGRRLRAEPMMFWGVAGTMSLNF
jgi:hypothetical protein